MNIGMMHSFFYCTNNNSIYNNKSCLTNFSSSNKIKSVCIWYSRPIFNTKNLKKFFVLFFKKSVYFFFSCQEFSFSLQIFSFFLEKAFNFPSSIQMISDLCFSFFTSTNFNFFNINSILLLFSIFIFEDIMIKIHSPLEPEQQFLFIKNKMHGSFLH